MSANLFVSELLLVMIASMGFIVFWQLYRSKDGMLRKIMMFYFLTEVFMFSTFAIYWWMKSRKMIQFSIVYLLPIWLLPKVIIKILFLDWLRRNRSND